jgi:hypothetical protein
MHLNQNQHDFIIGTDLLPVLFPESMAVEFYSKGSCEVIMNPTSCGVMLLNVSDVRPLDEPEISDVVHVDDAEYEKFINELEKITLHDDDGGGNAEALETKVSETSDEFGTNLETDGELVDNRNHGGANFNLCLMQVMSTEGDKIKKSLTSQGLENYRNAMKSVDQDLDLCLLEVEGDGSGEKKREVLRYYDGGLKCYRLQWLDSPTVDTGEIGADRC